jgi:TonB family protein
VARISVFEPSGKLLRNGTGFFVSPDGKIVTNRSLMEGAEYAVAKMTGGEIANISGILADTDTLDLAVLKAEVENRVPFIRPEESAGAKEGEKVAIIDSPMPGKPPFFQDIVSKRPEEEHGKSLELSFPVPNESLGSPVVNEQGQVIGTVTGHAGTMIRTFGAIEPVLAQASSDVKPRWLVAVEIEQSPASPAEAPPGRVPLAGEGNGRKSRLIYSPPPRYPSGVFQAGVHRRDGRYQIVFSRSGQARNVTILQSSQNEGLDRAAIEALRQWKSLPGESWVLDVPITFRP